LQAWKTMTEESKKEPAVAEKLLIDDLSDFQFHAAYLKYSDAYDKTTDSKIQKQLNQNMMDLQKSQIDYPTYYNNISQLLSAANPQRRYRRSLIKTQRKRDWRRKTQKRLRNKRHKK
jgi:hypothetical protein